MEEFIIMTLQLQKMVVVVEVDRGNGRLLCDLPAQLRKGLCHRTSHKRILPQARQFSFREEMTVAMEQLVPVLAEVEVLD